MWEKIIDKISLGDHILDLAEAAPPTIVLPIIRNYIQYRRKKFIVEQLNPIEEETKNIVKEYWGVLKEHYIEYDICSVHSREPQIFSNSSISSVPITPQELKRGTPDERTQEDVIKESSLHSINPAKNNLGTNATQQLMITIQIKAAERCAKYRYIDPNVAQKFAVQAIDNDNVGKLVSAIDRRSNARQKPIGHFILSLPGGDSQTSIENNTKLEKEMFLPIIEADLSALVAETNSNPEIKDFVNAVRRTSSISPQRAYGELLNNALDLKEKYKKIPTPELDQPNLQLVDTLKKIKGKEYVARGVRTPGQGISNTGMSPHAIGLITKLKEQLLTTGNFGDYKIEYIFEKVYAGIFNRPGVTVLGLREDIKENKSTIYGYSWRLRNENSVLYLGSARQMRQFIVFSVDDVLKHFLVLGNRLIVVAGTLSEGRKTSDNFFVQELSQEGRSIQVVVTKPMDTGDYTLLGTLISKDSRLKDVTPPYIVFEKIFL